MSDTLSNFYDTPKDRCLVCSTSKNLQFAHHIGSNAEPVYICASCRSELDAEYQAKVVASNADLDRYIAWNADQVPSAPPVTGRKRSDNG